MCDKAAGVPFPAHPASCHFVATVPWGTWVAADTRGGLVCGAPCCHFLFSGPGLAPELAVWVGLPHLMCGPVLELRGCCQPQGESLRNINKKPQGTSSCCCHLGARFPGNATEERPSHGCSL